MPKNVDIHIFINAAKQHFANRSEKTAVVIERKLKLLAEITDETIFDPSANGAGPEFYVALHELLSSEETNSLLAFAAADVLANAIRNRSARPEIINTFRFSWPVARHFMALTSKSTKPENRIENDNDVKRDYKLLCLLRELTYGIRLLWQESYLPGLIRVLLDIVSGTLNNVSNCKDDEVKTEDQVGEQPAVALAVLVNLCHRNLPAVYCLLRTIDGREFIRTLLRLNEGMTSVDANLQIQVSKMLVILEEVSGGIPSGSMQSFVHLTFMSMKEALVHRNPYLLQHVVDFFADVRGGGTSRPREALLSYNGYKEGVESLLAVVSEGCSSEEACFLMSFLCSLVELRVEGIRSLYPSLVSLAIGWIKGNGEASYHALNLLCMLMSSIDEDVDFEYEQEPLDVQENEMEVQEDSGGSGDDSAKKKRMSLCNGPSKGINRRQSLYKTKLKVSNDHEESAEKSTSGTSVKHLVTQALPDLLTMLEVIAQEVSQKFPCKGETRERLKSLFQLLYQLAKATDVREQMEDKIKKEVYASIFDPILGSESFMADDLFQMDVVGLYAEALRFGTMLAFQSAPWLTLCSRLLSHSQVLSLLAMALLAGDWVLRERVLTLVSTVAFPEESVASLAKAMNSMEPLLMTSDKCRGKVMLNGENLNSNCLNSMNGSNGFPLGCSQKLNEGLPILTREQESRLDSFIASLQKAKDNNKIEDIAMSALIELYEYKLAGISHAERALQASLDSATTHSCMLQHKLAQSSVELSRLHQLMYYKQQCLEGCQAEKQQLTLKLQNEELKAMEKHTQHMQEMRAKMREIEVSQRKEATLRKEFEAMAKEKEEEKEEFSKRLAALNERLKDLEESIQKKDKLLEERMKENERLLKVNKEQLEDNNSLRLVNKRNEQLLLEKEAKVKETCKELQEQQRIVEAIYEISARKKKMEK
ncbi:uncharacterized protein LOC124159250 isoform X2 [Ischnura elegans]|nr:uncharacterized protein LOC124159250 isoform X2 [Ischnura elegans]